MKRTLYILSLLFCVAVSSAQQGGVKKPLDIPVLLSGNFGELRSNHFHSGLDFKTQGAVGKAIYSPFDGYIVRATVTSAGYGKAVYVKHSNGYMTVYGHLDSFINPVEKAVREYQYSNETFVTDISFPPGEIPVKSGDIIAYSGNSGYSFGPHLHFELRSACGDTLYNPLRNYKEFVADNKTPKIHSLLVAPRIGQGSVCGGGKPLVCTPSSAAVPDTIVAWGVVGISFKADDYMDNTRNRYGVYRAQLLVDDSLRFESCMDEFALQHTRCINACIDYGQYSQKNGWYTRTHLLPNNPLGFLWADDSKGWLNIDEEREYNVECRIADYHGNVSCSKLVLKGRNSDYAFSADSTFHYLYWYMNNVVECEGMQLTLPMGQLFDNTLLKVKKVEAPGEPSDIYDFTEYPYVLREAATLSLTLNGCRKYADEKYYIRNLTDNGEYSMGGRIDNDRVTATITASGRYAIAVDTVAPQLKAVREKFWSRNRKIVFLLKETGSGLKSFKGYIDDKFVLFEYNSKNKILSCNLLREHLNRGQHTLRLLVADKAGNECMIIKNIKY